MKKVLLGIVILVVLVGVGGYLFQEPLRAMAIDQATKDMYLAGDDDDFDPGIAVGAQFPPILATIDGAVVTDIAEYSGPNGLVFVANRSVDW